MNRKRENASPIIWNQANQYTPDYRTKRSTLCCGYHSSICTEDNDLHLLDVVRGHALCLPASLDFGPAVSTISVDENESITFNHAEFRVTAGLVVIQRHNILDFLRTASRSNSRANAFRCRTSRLGGRRVGVG